MRVHGRGRCSPRCWTGGPRTPCNPQTLKLNYAPAQVQYSLLDRRPENGMADFCAQHGIALLPYGTTAGGLLSSRYLGLRASRRGRVCARILGYMYSALVRKHGCTHQPLQKLQLVLEASSAVATLGLPASQACKGSS